MRRDIRPVPPEIIKISPELNRVQGMMPISDNDRETLKKDIELEGRIRDAIKAYEGEDGDLYLLGGLNRLEIAKELGYEVIDVEVIAISDDDREDFAIRDNLSRRHFTREQKSKLTQYYVEKFPEKSNRYIASLMGISHNTVGKMREETTGQTDQLGVKREGKDGRLRDTTPKSIKDIAVNIAKEGGRSDPTEEDLLAAQRSENHKKHLAAITRRAGRLAEDLDELLNDEESAGVVAKKISPILKKHKNLFLAKK